MPKVPRPVRTPPAATTVSAEGKARPRAAVAAAADPAAADRLLPDRQDETFHLVVLDPFADEDATPGHTATRPRFVRLFASYAGARVSAPMRVRSTPGARQTRFRDIIATHERIKRYSNFERGSLPDDAALVRFGSDLFDTLFQGDVRRLYDEARARQHGRPLDLVLTSMVPWIAEKPWEFAYDPGRQSFLATEDIHFVRNVLTAVPADVPAPQRAPLRILVASAQPLGLGQLSVREETAVIRRGFERLVAAGLADIEILPRATPSKIHQRLQGGAFSVVHFIGHGVFDETTQQGALVFEDAQRQQLLLGQRSVREIFGQRGVRLVFLNACQTGSGGTGEFNKGVAQALVAHGLPALVANQYSVLDVSATLFARHFYWSLAQGASIGCAAREARIAVNYGVQGESIDWAIPVVYARDPAMRLCQPAAGAAGAAVGPAPIAAKRTRTRSPRATSRYRVAVWDIDGSFPELAATLQRLDAAQQHFGFSLAEHSLPLNSWDLLHRAADGMPMLRADRVAQRLAGLPIELHVHVVVGISRHRLRDDRHRDLDAWWPARTYPAVLLASCAGFAELPRGGRDADQLVANLLTATLVGYLGGIDVHANAQSGSAAARPAQTMLRPLRFDRDSRERLQSRIGGQLASLERLSRAFAPHARSAR